MPIRNLQSTIRNCSLALLVLLAAAPPAAAQDTGPLRKTDLIRLLASGRPPGNVALMVRRRCLAFTPSPRDRFDLAAAGADREVLDAIDGCAARANARGGTGTLRIVAPARVRAAAGSEVAITVRLLRGGVPQAGKALQMHGATAIPGGSLQEPGAVTDARGLATFHLLAGVAQGTYPLEVLALGDMPAQASLQFIATVPPLQADVSPPVLVVREGSRVPALLRVQVRGAGGVPVAALPVLLRGISAQLGPTDTVATDGTGAALLAIPPGAVRSSGTIGVYARGTLVASVPVRIEAPVISDERTQFLAGVGQRGSVHATLRQPLVIEVRDTAGAPVAGYGIRFTSTNATFAPAETATDSTGQARTTVTLGDHAGPVTIAAEVGRVTRTTSVFAAPGPAQTLVLEHDGRPIDSLYLATSAPVTVRAVVRDAWGNEALLAGLTASVQGGAAALRNLRGATAPPGTLVLEPRRSGRATLEVSAAGEGQRIGARLPLQVTMPLASGDWLYGARIGGAAFDYNYKPSPAVGRSGFRSELMVGRRLAPGFRLQGGIGLGVVRAQYRSASLAVGLIQGLLRGEYAFTGDRGGLSPVLTVGGGAYRIKSTDQTHVVYHTSLFWLIGAGIDYPLSPTLDGVVRLERQQLYEANSKFNNGPVGSLTLLEVGVRVTP